MKTLGEELDRKTKKTRTVPVPFTHLTTRRMVALLLNLAEIVPRELARLIVVASYWDTLAHLERESEMPVIEERKTVERGTMVHRERLVAVLFPENGLQQWVKVHDGYWTSQGRTLLFPCCLTCVTRSTFGGMPRILPSAHQHNKQSIDTLLSFYRLAERKSTQASFEIRVRRLSGKTTMLLVEPDDTICDVKQMIYEKENIPVDEIMLVFAGLSLDRWCGVTLSERGITANATLHFVQKLRCV